MPRFKMQFLFIIFSVTFILSTSIQASPKDKKEPVIELISPKLDEKKECHYASESRELEVKIKVTGTSPITSVRIGHQKVEKPVNGLYIIKVKMEYVGKNYLSIEASHKNRKKSYFKFAVCYESLDLSPEQKEEKEAYEKALTTNTIEAYKTYLKKYPYSDYQDEVQEKLRELSTTNFEARKQKVEARVKKVVANYHGSDEWNRTLSNLSTNPYYFKKDDGYYFLNFIPDKWISETACLAKVWVDQNYVIDEYSGYFYVNIGTIDSGKIEKYGVHAIMWCTGIHSYTTVLGEIMLVPKFILIDSYEIEFKNPATR